MVAPNLPKGVNKSGTPLSPVVPPFFGTKTPPFQPCCFSKAHRASSNAPRAQPRDQRPKAKATAQAQGPKAQDPRPKPKAQDQRPRAWPWDLGLGTLDRGTLDLDPWTLDLDLGTLEPWNLGTLGPLGTLEPGPPILGSPPKAPKGNPVNPGESRVPRPHPGPGTKVQN